MSFTEEQIAQRIEHIKQQQEKAKPALMKMAAFASVAGVPGMTSMFSSAIIPWDEERLRQRTIGELKKQEIQDHNKLIDEKRRAKKQL